MANQPKDDGQRLPHTFCADNRKTLTLTGVREVVTFDENQLILMTGLGELAISGGELHMTTLLLDEGRVTVEGRLDALVYSDRTAGRKRLRGLLR